MIDILKDPDDTVPHTKFHFSHSLLPSYIDPQNVSRKKKPFSTFNAMNFTHTVDLLLPEEMWELVRDTLDVGNDGGLGKTTYARVYMKLGEMLEKEFLEEYIKKGNIMMRSEGRPLIDNIISLHSGQLRLELDRPTYERTGLQGRPVEDGGKKHQKSRWVVEFDLRLPSMKHGKKGFGRLEWACKNVLDQSLTWLFCNLQPGNGHGLNEAKEALSKHAPFIKDVEREASIMKGVLCPRLKVGDLDGLYAVDDSLALLEYLHALSLDSPRLKAADSIDPFLSRFQVPDLGRGVVTKNFMRVKWHGFMPSQFIQELFLTVRRNGLKIDKEDQDGEGGTKRGDEERWFAISARGFGGDVLEGGGRSICAYTVLQFAGRETLVWGVE